MNRYPTVYSTVDVAIYSLLATKGGGKPYEILMGKKGDKFCFIGGFVDPQDQDLKQAACREVKEETGFNLKRDLFTQPEYEFSMRVDDPRYRGTKDGIMTHFFSVFSPAPNLPDPKKIADKEFKEFAWIRATKKSLPLVSEIHRPLFLKFINSKGKK